MPNAPRYRGHSIIARVPQADTGSTIACRSIIVAIMLFNTLFFLVIVALLCIALAWISLKATPALNNIALTGAGSDG